MQNTTTPKPVANHIVAQASHNDATDEARLRQAYALNDLTSAYEIVAQMSITFADNAGYLNNASYAVIAPEGDETNDNLPFLIDATRTKSGKYNFLSYDAQWMHTVDYDFQVLVYSIPNQEMSAKQQYKLLFQFANQFEHDSLIGQLLSPALLHWLAENSDMPNIFKEYQRARHAINSIEGHLDDLEELI